MTAPQAPSFQDNPTLAREIIDIPQEVVVLDPSTLGPAGSPLLPTDHLELILATPDDCVSTLGTPLEESGFHSSKHSMLISTPKSSELSNGDVEALVETWLKDFPEESHDWERVWPKLGRSSPLPLSVLAWEVFLSSEQARKEESFEMPRLESNSHEGPAVLMRDVFMGSLTPNSGFGSDHNISNSEICRNLESEMEDAAQNLNHEAFDLEEEQPREAKQ